MSLGRQQPNNTIMKGNAKTKVLIPQDTQTAIISLVVNNCPIKIVLAKKNTKAMKLYALTKTLLLTLPSTKQHAIRPVSYTHLRAHET